VRLVTVPEHYHTVVDWIEDRDSLSAEELCEQLRATIEAAPMFTPPTKDHEESATNDGVGLVPLGEIDPESGRLVLSPKRTLPTAEAFVREFYRHPEGRTLLNYAGMFLAWQYNHYREVEDESLRQRLQPWLHDALRYIYNPRTKVSTLTNFDSNPGTVKAALDSLRTYVHIPALLTPPAWLDNQAGRPLPQDILPCRSALWHLPTLTTLPSTPKLFVTHALGCDYDPKAVEPTGWLAFLNQVFPGDAEAIALLQTWFGYSLTTDTSLQKMLLLVGAKRSGKGTIARVLTRLLGTDNVCGPTISSLASQFGLQPLLGKSLAIVSDARFTGDNVATVVERLLCISGEDTLTVDRKFQTSVTMKLSTRFMFLTNELPKMSETSGALANRFLILRFTQSFLGKEDPDLTNKLVLELPGILRWAVAGWHKLRAQGRFATSESSKEGVEQLEEICSPVATFVRDCCHTGLAYKCDLRDLYEAWKTWCQDNGRDYPGSVQTFGRDLSAAVPTARTRRNQVTGRFVEGVGLVNPPPKTSESKDKGDS
jgi:putative DNA primase/helicase